MKKKVLTEIFDNLEKSLYSDMSIRIENNLEDGMYREYLVKKVLEPQCKHNPSYMAINYSQKKLHNPLISN